MNKAATESEPKRRWYQYSLRTLLIVMVLFCFLFAWVGVKIREGIKQRNVVEWVEQMGGEVYYDYQVHLSEEFQYSTFGYELNFRLVIMEVIKKHMCRCQGSMTTQINLENWSEPPKLVINVILYKKSSL